MPNRNLIIVREALFPPLCYGCKKEIYEHVPLCASCSTSLHSDWKTICPVCEKEKTFLQKRRCAHAPSYLSTLSYMTLFSQTPVRGLIHTLKYSGIQDAVSPFEDLLQHEKVNAYRIPADFIVPVPLHKRRERERGFNQTFLIAKALSNILTLPMRADVLVRRRASQPQARSRSRADRVKNVRGLFKVSGEFEQGSSVLLVDDVSTSGSTLEEASRILVQAGARAVHGFTLAREK